MASEIESKGKINAYGKKIFLIGTSDLGPVNTPVKAISATHVRSVFGSQGTLLEAFRIIKETEFDCEVYLIKTTGIHSEAYLHVNEEGGTILEDGFYIKSKYANEKYNDIKITIDQDALYVHYGKQLGDYTMEYKFSDHISLIDLAEAINDDTRKLNGHIYCYTNCNPGTMSAGALSGVNPDTIKLTGGNSGLYYNKNMIYNCLSDTYSILEGRDVDIIIPLACYYDDTFSSKENDIDNFYDMNREYLTLKKNDEEYLSYYEQLLDFCIGQMRFGYLTQGIMGLNPTGNPFIDEESYLEVLEHFKHINQVPMSKRKYKHLISVCAGDMYCTFGTRILNGYVAYAALIAALMIKENTTNKPIPDSFTLYNTFSNECLEKLRELGYTSFRFSPLKNSVVVSNGITTSDEEEFKYLCNVRMSHLTMRYVREYLTQFIGQDLNTLIKTKELESGLVTLLAKLVDADILEGFSVNEVVNINTGHLFLDMSFKTLFMLEEIKAYSGIAAIK